MSKNILLLCHGKRHSLVLCHDNKLLESCPTTGIPLTMKVTNDTYTLDAMKESEADKIADWRKPTTIRKKFNIVTTRCCHYSAFIREQDGGLEDNSFRNVEKVLKKGGYFIYDIATYGVYKFGKYMLNNGYYMNNRNIKGDKWWKNELPEWKKKRKINLVNKKKLEALREDEIGIDNKTNDELYDRIEGLMVLYIEHKYKKLRLIREKKEMNKFYDEIEKKYLTKWEGQRLKSNYDRYPCWHFIKK